MHCGVDRLDMRSAAPPTDCCHLSRLRRGGKMAEAPPVRYSEESYMSYSEFTLQELREKLSLHIMQAGSLFASVAGVRISEHLSTTLAENIALALNINTEKARSEMIIVPVLIELRKMMQRRMSLFSGVEFDVDAALNLNGFCDYIISKSTNQLYPDAPVVILVEAKNENIKTALPQCIATMYAANLYNTRECNAIRSILGVVTTGSNWKFLQLHTTHVAIDYDEYLISDVGKILAIMLQVLQDEKTS
jgi:hypothetical protein